MKDRKITSVFNVDDIALCEAELRSIDEVVLQEKQSEPIPPSFFALSVVAP